MGRVRRKSPALLHQVGCGGEVEGWVTRAGALPYLPPLPRKFKKMAPARWLLDRFKQINKTKETPPWSTGGACVSSGGRTCLAPGAVGGGKWLLGASPPLPAGMGGFVPGILPSMSFSTGTMPSGRAPACLSQIRVCSLRPFSGLSKPGDKAAEVLPPLGSQGVSSSPRLPGLGELGFSPKTACDGHSLSEGHC